MKWRVKRDVRFYPAWRVIPFSRWGKAGMGVGQIALATSPVPQGQVLSRLTGFCRASPVFSNPHPNPSPTG
ncbi:hypothetical protein CHUV0807_0487 [Cardiobacterium hominis]|uniref:Uncharacterized protein n=1 Tax=Cardiobacterium hominis TaxID=2718 RepID=A0A1C3H2N1_9GAMM|nr:hypothetical protein CHUV0807_0487 [Cardiobacterium hominis]